MRLSGAVLAVAAIAAMAGAPVAFAQDTVVNADRAQISQKIVVGGTTFGEVLRIVGAPTTSLGTGTINPMGIDADGDVVRDSATAVSTGGAWTWGVRGMFSNGLTVGTTLTGAANPGTGTILDIDTTTRVATIQPQYRLYETDQPPNLRYWFLRGQDQQIFMEAWDDAITTRSTLWRGYKRASIDPNDPFAVGTPDTFELGATVRNFWPETSSFSKLGNFNRRWLSLDVDTLRAQTFVVNETQAFTNGALLVSRGSNLTRDLSNSATVIHVEHKGFRYHDFAVMRGLSTTNGAPQAEWIKLNTGSYDCTEGDADKTAGSPGANPPLHANCLGVDNNDYAYAVIRDQAGSGAFPWAKGSAVPSTDRYLDIYAFNDATITYGGAVIGDKAVGYWNFDDAPTTTFNAARSGGGDASAIGTGAGTCGGSAWPGTAAPSGCGAWFRPTGAGNGLLTQPITLADLNLSQPGQKQDEAFACHGTVEMVAFIPPASTISGTTYVDLVSKWSTVSLSSQTFIIRHYGPAAGAALEGKIDLIGSRNGSLTILRSGVIAGWNHLVFTWGNHNGDHIYVNGVRHVSNAPTALCNVNNDDPIRVEGWTAPNGGGSHIAELAVYAYDLEEEQVKAHYRALQTDRAGLHTGPTIAGFERQSDVNWYGVSPRWACGNLAGYYDYRRQTYGCGFGDYTGDWTAIDDKGWRVMHQNNVKMRAQGGNLYLTGDLHVETSGQLRSGATGYDTGVGYWIDYNGGAPRFRIGTETTAVTPRYLRWTPAGDLEFKTDRMKLSSAGIDFLYDIGGGSQAARITWGRATGGFGSEMFGNAGGVGISTQSNTQGIGLHAGTCCADSLSFGVNSGGNGYFTFSRGPGILRGDVRPSTDGLQDMGLAANRWRYGFFKQVSIGSVGTPFYDLELSADLAAKPSTSTWTMISDREAKRNIVDYDEALSKIRAVHLIRYEYNGRFGSPEGAKGVGVVAQEIGKIFPDSVQTATRDGNSFQTFNAHELFMANVKATQELDAEVNALRAKVEAMEKNVARQP
jgi:hypothetical protein